jgi:hypothetical protein
MSHIATQRAIVRMLFDERFAGAVYRDSDQALADAGVSADERRWLTAPDARAYRTDPHFCDRALHGLLSEFPVSGALALRAGADLRRFFSSETLHRCVQSGGVLAPAFGDWLCAQRRIREVLVKETAQIELALAGVRRSRGTTGGAQCTLAKSAALVSAGAGVLSVYQGIQRQLAAHARPVADVALDTLVELVLKRPALGPGERLLAELKHDGTAAIENLSDALGDLLHLAEGGCTLEALYECARSHGAEAGEDVDVVDGLVRDGLVVIGEQ